MATANTLGFHFRLPTRPRATRSPAPADKLPVWLCGVTAIFGAGTAWLVLQLVWLQTLWSWEQGPHVAGFALANSDRAILFLTSLWLVACLIGAVGLTLRALVKKRRVRWTRWAVFAGLTLILAVPYLPYGFWQRLFIERLIDGPHAAEFLTHAAATGDLPTVEKFIAHGVYVDTRDRLGRTSVHYAAAEGQLAVLEYLLARGVDVNAVDRFGDSPLELALARHHDAAANLLAGSDARRISGDTVYRQHVLQEIFLDDLVQVLDKSGI